MSRKLQLALPSLTLALILGGCSGTLIESKKIDYKTAAKASGVSLEVPPDLTTPSRDERYVVPDLNPKGTATYSAYSAERSGARAGNATEVLPTAPKIQVMRDGNQRWLVVADTPEKLWPVVKDFWQETGFIVNREVVDAGIMETDWAENRANIPMDAVRNLLGKVLDSLYSTPERDKFRTRLERGAVPGTTEVYISHRGMMELYVTEAKDQTRWQPRPADPELEAEMLRRLMVRLGTEEVRAKALMGVAAPENRAKLERTADGGNALKIAESFDRAWRRVGLALDRVGFTVEDRDRVKGLYFVRYVDPEADNKKEGSGWMSKLAFWRGSDKSAPDKIQYRILVKGQGDLSTVQVLSAEGGEDKSESANRILNLLANQLR